MEKFYFSATLSRERVSLKNGNVELYSLNESLENGVMWKLTLSPTESLHVQGYVEKIENRQVVQFEGSDAVSAIKGGFSKVQSIVSVPPMNDFFVFKSKEVAFTLRVPDNLQSELEEYQLQNFSREVLDLSVAVRTSNIKREDTLSCVRGLLTLDRELPLEDCAEILAAANFPRKMITWLTYCTNVEAWTCYFGPTLREN